MSLLSYSQYQSSRLDVNKAMEGCGCRYATSRNRVFLLCLLSDPEDYMKRFSMAVGPSAKDLFHSGRKKKGLTLSQRALQDPKELGSVLHLFIRSIAV